jgi:hypothetical protein
MGGSRFIYLFAWRLGSFPRELCNLLFELLIINRINKYESFY